MTTVPKAMPIDPERVPNRYRPRELRASQLGRYVYLADLARAETYDGRICTGVPWRSHHLRAWAPADWQLARALAADLALVFARAVVSGSQEEHLRRRAVHERGLALILTL